MNISLSAKQVYLAAVFFIVLGLMYLALNAIITDALSTSNVVLDKAERRAVESRLMYSPHCLAFQAGSPPRIYSGRIDPDRFTGEIIQNCVPYDSGTDPGLLVELRYVDKTGTPVNKNFETISYGLKKTTGKRFTNSYPVFIEGEGEGVMKFTHRI